MASDDVVFEAVLVPCIGGISAHRGLDVSWDTWRKIEQSINERHVGRRPGGAVPLTLFHKANSVGHFGSVRRAWRDADGRGMAEIVVSKPYTDLIVGTIKSGAAPAVSLHHNAADGAVAEVSLCRTPARRGAVVTEIRGGAYKRWRPRKLSDQPPPRYIAAMSQMDESTNEQSASQQQEQEQPPTNGAAGDNPEMGSADLKILGLTQDKWMQLQRDISPATAPLLKAIAMEGAKMQKRSQELESQHEASKKKTVNQTVTMLGTLLSQILNGDKDIPVEQARKAVETGDPEAALRLFAPSVERADRFVAASRAAYMQQQRGRMADAAAGSARQADGQWLDSLFSTQQTSRKRGREPDEVDDHQADLGKRMRAATGPGAELPRNGGGGGVAASSSTAPREQEDDMLSIWKTIAKKFDTPARQG